MKRIKLTVAIGLSIVISTSLGILWTLGVIFHEEFSNSTADNVVQITPDCIITSGMQIEFKVLSHNDSHLNIVFELPQEDSNFCRNISVQSSHDIDVMDTIVFDELNHKESTGNKASAGTSLQNSVQQFESPDGKVHKVFKFDVKNIDKQRSVWLVFRINDPVALKTYSEGDIVTLFIVDKLINEEMPVSFLLVLGRDVRVTARDLNAFLEDPRKPNIYRYGFKPQPVQFLLGISLAASVDFSVEFPDRDRFKEVLLVIFSALFGVGISALFESLLAIENYNYLASVFPSSNTKKRYTGWPTKDDIETENDSNNHKNNDQ